jgi:hypothetical protein
MTGAGLTLAPIRFLESLFVHCIADVVGETLIVVHDGPCPW